MGASPQTAGAITGAPGCWITPRHVQKLVYGFIGIYLTWSPGRLMARGRCSPSAQLHRAASCLQGSKHRQFPCFSPMAGASCLGMCSREPCRALSPAPHSEGLPVCGTGQQRAPAGTHSAPQFHMHPHGRWHHGARQRPGGWATCGAQPRNLKANISGQLLHPWICVSAISPARLAYRWLALTP